MHLLLSRRSCVAEVRAMDRPTVWCRRSLSLVIDAVAGEYDGVHRLALATMRSHSVAVRETAVVGGQSTDIFEKNPA